MDAIALLDTDSAPGPQSQRDERGRGGRIKLPQPDKVAIRVSGMRRGGLCRQLVEFPTEVSRIVWGTVTQPPQELIGPAALDAPSA